MRLRIMSILAALALVTACETPQQTTAATSGSGSGSGAGAQGAARIAPGSQEDLVVNVGDRVFFDFNKHTLKPDARKTLEKQAAWLKQHPSVRILVAGNCDERGTREYNLALGERRANSTKDHLVSLGVDPNRIKTISYGKERPVALGSTEAAWAQNRNSITSVVGAGS